MRIKKDSKTIWVFEFEWSEVETLNNDMQQLVSKGSGYDFFRLTEEFAETLEQIVEEEQRKK